MRNLTKSEKTYIIIVFIMLIGKGIWSYFKLDDPLIQRSINSWTMMILIAVVGYICLQLAQKIDFPDIWDEDVSNNGRFIIPAIYGVGFAAVQIVLVTIQKMKIPMVKFPLSIPVYSSVGILSELIFHFIPVVFLLWLISYRILKNRWQVQNFWVIAILVSIWEPILQLVMMYKMGILNNILAGVLPFLLVFGANIIPIHFLRKYGLLSAIIWRLSDYLIWHIIWGGFFVS